MNRQFISVSLTTFIWIWGSNYDCSESASAALSFSIRQTQLAGWWSGTEENLREKEAAAPTSKSPGQGTRARERTKGALGSSTATCDLLAKLSLDGLSIYTSKVALSRLGSADSFAGKPFWHDKDVRENTLPL